MKKILLSLLVFGMSFTSFAQDEQFVKSLKKLEYGSTILDAAMLFKKDWPQFQVLNNAGPVQITVFTNPYDETQKFKIDALYLLNNDDKQLVQLYYVNDALYQKSVFWFLHKDSVELVETNYQKAKNTFISNPVLIRMEGGKVKAEESSYELGKKTLFPVEKQGKNERVGQAGYELVYTSETGARGFWVYMQAYNTMDCGLDMTMDFPLMGPPKGTFDDLENLLSPLN